MVPPIVAALAMTAKLCMTGHCGGGGTIVSNIIDDDESNWEAEGYEEVIFAPATFLKIIDGCILQWVILKTQITMTLVF